MKRAGPTVQDFREHLERELESRGRSVRLWKQAHSESSHLLVIDSKPATVLYVKERNSDKGWWGLTETYLGDLETSRTRWLVVLLLGVASQGYFLSADAVLGHLGPGGWTLAKDGDFKINEPRDLSSSDRFSTFEEFVERLVKYCAGAV